jgi:hypothetical protein
MTFVPASRSEYSQVGNARIDNKFLFFYAFKSCTETGGEAGSAHKATWKIGSHQGQCGLESSPRMG